MLLVWRYDDLDQKWTNPEDARAWTGTRANGEQECWAWAVSEGQWCLARQWRGRDHLNQEKKWRDVSDRDRIPRSKASSRSLTAVLASGEDKVGYRLCGKSVVKLVDE